MQSVVLCYFLKRKTAFYLLFLCTIIVQWFKSSPVIKRIKYEFYRSSFLHSWQTKVLVWERIFSQIMAIWLTHLTFTEFSILNGAFIINFLHHFIGELSCLPLGFGIGENGNLNAFQLTVKIWFGKNPLK